MITRDIHLETAGSSGTPVLLLHGIGGSSTSFAAQFETLPQHYEVLAWDAPGYGTSADPGSAPGMSGYAATVAELLEERGSAHLVGVSWGGVIAARVAANYPRLVRSLTLADSSRGSGRSVEGAARMHRRATELVEHGARAFAGTRGPRLLSRAADPALVETVVSTMAAVRLPGYAFAARAMAETDHTELIRRIAVPTLVIVGEEDHVTGVDESRLIAESIPGARLEIVPGAGHAANQECPERFNRLLLGFLNSVDATVMAGDHR